MNDKPDYKALWDMACKDAGSYLSVINQIYKYINFACHRGECVRGNMLWSLEEILRGFAHRYPGHDAGKTIAAMESKMNGICHAEASLGPSPEEMMAILNQTEATK